MRCLVLVVALLAVSTDARVLRGAGGPSSAATAPYYTTAALGAASAVAIGASDLPEQGGKGGKGRGEGTALPGFATAGVAARGTGAPAPTSETHNNGGAGLPEGTALPMVGSTAMAGPGPATPASAVDTSLARKEEEAPAVPAPVPEAADAGPASQPELKTSSVPFNGAGAAAEGYVAAQAGVAP